MPVSSEAGCEQAATKAGLKINKTMDRRRGYMSSSDFCDRSTRLSGACCNIEYGPKRASFGFATPLRFWPTNPAMGPLNRRGFAVHAEQQIERSGDLRLAVFDIDRFKRTNDVNKHGTRDEVLCTCAQVAKTLARKLKPAASLSGEELVIVLSDSTLEQAMTICERLRKLIENEVTIVEDRSIKVTMSGGTSEFVKNSAIDAMLAAAELAQYERNGQEGN